MSSRVATTSWEEATGEPAREMEEGWREVEDCFLRRGRGSPLEEALLEGLGRRRRKCSWQSDHTRDKSAICCDINIVATYIDPTLFTWSSSTCPQGWLPAAQTCNWYCRHLVNIELGEEQATKWYWPLCHSVTLKLRLFVTMSLFYCVTVWDWSRFYSFIVSLCIFQPHHFATVSLCNKVTVSICNWVTL